MDFVDYGWLSKEHVVHTSNCVRSTIFLATRSECGYFRDATTSETISDRDALSETFSHACSVDRFNSSFEYPELVSGDYTVMVCENWPPAESMPPVVMARESRKILVVQQEDVTLYLSHCMRGLLHKPKRAAACVIPLESTLDNLNVFNLLERSAPIWHRLGNWAAYDDCSSHGTTDKLGITTCIRIAQFMNTISSGNRINLTETKSLKHIYVNTAALKMFRLSQDALYTGMDALKLLHIATNEMHGCPPEQYVEVDKGVCQGIDTEFRKTKDLAKRLENIEYHPQGAKSSRKFIYRLLAWGYVVLTVVLALIVAVLNVASRDNVFERLTDMVAVLTTMLVTVFGLLKLTSEDPNAIRNTLRGFKILHYFEEVMREIECNDVEEFRRALSVGAVDADWLDREGSCYADLSRSGNIRDSIGSTLGELISAGWFFSKYRRTMHTI